MKNLLIVVGIIILNSCNLPNVELPIEFTQTSVEVLDEAPVVVLYPFPVEITLAYANSLKDELGLLDCSGDAPNLVFKYYINPTTGEPHPNLWNIALGTIQSENDFYYGFYNGYHQFSYGNNKWNNLQCKLIEVQGYGVQVECIFKKEDKISHLFFSYNL